ncbi:EamA family transporter [uncultured Thiohalocapsa sp.]|uniref:EamA family transporter n=1 Tax=uncultured Thiohalocapsa sp. TaxID=768990 RepID=UPI002600DD54|nr:EamA family transporter [uncultured Thiohalocapsa sp.]
MNIRAWDYAYIFATIGLTVYGQLMLKWRIGAYGPLPAELFDKLRFLTGLFFDPLILSGFIAAFGAALAWMAAMTKFDLSHAYPFMALNFVLVLLLSGWLFQEPVTAMKVIGVTLIVIGTIVSALG